MPPPPPLPRLPRLGFVGAGRMATAMVGGLLASGLVAPANVLVGDPNTRARDRFQHAYPSVGMAESNVAVASESDVVVLAVKPQSLKAVTAELHGRFRPGAVLLSIVAGVTMDQVKTMSGVAAVARCMPNTPAAVLHSMSVWTCNEGVTDTQKTAVRRLLGTFGSEVFVSDEGLLDMATALSGSGPAYFFMIMEAMVDAGVHMGFTREQARMLVVQTMLGSAKLASQSDAHLAALRNDITSPGGTSAAALYEAERGNLRTVISDSIWAAYRRSLELGGQSSNIGPGRFKR